MNLCIAKPNKNCALETFIINHIKRLKPSEIICRGYFPGEFENKKGNIYPWWLKTRLSQGVIKNMLPGIFQRIYTNSISSYLQKTDADIVFAEYGLVGANITQGCRKAKIPLVTIFHGFDAFEKSTLLAYREKYQLLFNYAHAIIAVSKEMTQQLISLGADKNKVHWIPYGVDITKFHPPDRRKENDVITFIFIGRLTPKKAPLLLIQSFYAIHRSMPNTQLLLAGDGELREDCEKLINQLGLQKRVTLKGSVPPAEVPELLQAADIYVQHSIISDAGDSEGTPNSILEASASGLPVISTLHGGIPDIVIHGTSGYLVPEKDIEAMSHYMKLLADDKPLRERLGNAGRENIQKNFRLEKSIEAIEALLEKAVK